MPSFTTYPSGRLCQNARPTERDPDFFPADTIIQLLRSGRSPFDLDNISLSKIRQDIHKLESHVAAFDLAIRGLQKHKNRVNHNLRMYHSLFAPIRRLPLDVLIHIFQLLPVDTIDPNSTPWILGLVCYSWRSVYLSVPTLWSRIFIDIRAGAELRPQSVSMLHTSLSRSQRSPLTISASYDNQSSPISPFLFSILDLLISHLSRWSVVEFHIPRLSYHIFDRLGPLPMLRTINVTLDPRVVPLGTRDLLMHSPQLRAVSLTAIPLSSVDLPLSRLSSLDGVIQTPEHLFNILNEAKGLEALTISSSKFLSGHPSCGTLTVPNICRLHFRSVPVQEISNSLLFPNLKYLVLGAHSGAQPYSSSDIRSVVNMIERSQCPLRSLSLNFTVCLCSIAAISSNLTQLSIMVESWAACETFVSLRVGKDGGRDLVPNLVELRITDVTSKCGGQSFTHEPFGPMIESRWNGGRLRRLEMHVKYGWGDPYYSEVVRRTLGKYVDEGLDVVIFDGECVV
ncbi:uncharacterized protein BT62DRAFT_1077098 [Guyanagaster necrorhizus]|uniref:F-box domain-containing protein n=1 Tax=Guyanagaster necrorhizus TaxID=856835 RepID=A0A9P7VR96_9AGAR|nr:uncharacterized protein BT62DRAFT_933274 [Guyanagaster necrorhizus MCA 3950]XP_043038952.1 uncharacterized protein BT62DRAFT_1077098 [Guyanagaster necrorhizus MCA 3950]KAG7445449.1 hypothetical protein BT62DRAFT_933274 [Guyanagaster necrorhizus MCA 3950]KAG7445452.1 hypothetical protein BT62DRAFT_1077098 [Guyanagaster necrorhizus MCA 3950]